MLRRHTGQTLLTLFEIACDSQQGLQQQVYRLLQLGRERFGMEFGSLAKITDQRYQVRQQLSPAQSAWHDGDLYDLQDTYCALAIAARRPFGFADIAQTDIADHPAQRKLGLKAYLGVPLARAENYTAPSALPVGDPPGEHLRLPISPTCS